jgi:hypothetical protein
MNKKTVQYSSLIFRFPFLLLLLFATLPSFSQSIGIIGTATPISDWNTDVDMLQDAGDPNLWTLSIILTSGEVKFRQDNSWIISWGGTTFPTGTGVLDGPNIPVTAGNYLVSFHTGTLVYSFNSPNYGNVGIGTLTPSEKLDVDGNIKLSGELKPGGIAGVLGQSLQSNGDGTMQWGEKVTANGGIGYGTWGGCDMANVTEYNPVSDPNGQPGDFSGSCVSISGDYAIVGSPNDDDAAGSNQGSISIFRHNPATGIWEQQGTKLFNPGAAANDYFGISVSISGDYAIAGAYEDDEGIVLDQGSASIFKRNASTGVWEVQGSKLFNPLAGLSDYFGASVSISGDYAIVGADGDNEAGLNDQGSASIFKRNPSTGEWEVQGAKLLNPGGAPGDYFGRCVSISGDYVIIGAPYDDTNPFVDQGSASIFMRNNSTGVWEFQVPRLFNPGASADDHFGNRVSISGDYAIVGAPDDDDAAGADQGSACIFRRNASTGAWELQGSKLLNLAAAASDNFGGSVSISGNYAIVSAENDDEAAGVDQGSSTIYVNTGSVWRRLQKVSDPAGEPGDHFGTSCAIDGTTRRFINGASNVFGGQGMAVFGKVD